MHPDRLGAQYQGDNRCRFFVWAPLAEEVQLHLVSPRERTIPMKRDGRGYHQLLCEDVAPGARYFYLLDGATERPDPASRFQPEGVHGPSQVIDPKFSWEDQSWFGIPLKDYIFYELHVGTFTPVGTFDGVIEKIDYLQTLGVTALEVMPVAQFPGERNWGYDGTYPFAVQNTYGGPEGLKRLVNACHRSGLAVVLDVVYNHLGPEGNYLRDYGPYFTNRYATPWGEAVNLDGPYSDDVRHFFLENGLYWVREFHVDALRVDAVHAIYDFSARTFLSELAETVHEAAEQLNRRIHVIPESALNDVRLIQVPELGGMGLDAQWNDDFHHALQTALTGEQGGYYQDFGGLGDLAKAFREGFVYAGQYSAYRKRRHGNSSREVPARRFVVFSQNHDQVGNRMRGDRLSALVNFEKLKLAAGVLLLSPFLPLLFMGEEYGESAPFPYFISHSDPDLVQAVREGRRREFQTFAWQGEPPDPADPAVFRKARIQPSLRRKGRHRILFDLYCELIRMRKEIPALFHLNKDQMRVRDLSKENILTVHRWSKTDRVFGVFHFGDSETSVNVPLPPGHWSKELDSSDARWEGPGSTLPVTIDSQGEVALTLEPQAFALFTQEVPS